jgi:hypothetical protein
MNKLIFLLMILLVACSSTNTSQNIVRSTETEFKGGVYKDKSWNDALEFQRFSWYHGGTLYLDTFIHRLNESSPFAQWLSESEKSNFKTCNEFLLAMTFTSNSIFTNIKHSDFKSHMEKNGFSSISLMDFEQHIRIHATFEAWNMRRYKVEGFCRNAPGLSQKVTLNFPGFKELQFKIK